MNLEKRFIEIRSFLNEHTYLHEFEALLRHPHFSDKYLPWAKDIQTLSEDDKFELENTLNPKSLNNTEYIDFLKTIHNLIDIPKFATQVKPIDSILGTKIKGKKKHEIQIIESQLDHLHTEHFIDIGSGAGHLSSILLYKNQKTSECIDMNHDFQKIGMKKLTKFFPDILKRIKFTHCEINPNSKLETLKSTTLMGLHSCGDLSVNIIKNFKKGQFQNLLSYGCCYHKLSDESQNLSKIANERPIYFTNHALTIATKSYKEISKKEYQFRKNVKFYRYSLHLIMSEYLSSDFKSIGSATAHDYQGSFSDYALKYAPELGPKFTPIELEEFFNSKENIANVQFILDFGIIRSHIARVVELYIILDRALYLKEYGFEIKLEETFDKNISPRNLSLLATRPL